MKTVADLNALIPTLTCLLSKHSHDIGPSCIEHDEDGCCRYDKPNYNCFCYDEDGWLVEVSYDCFGEWDTDPGDYWTPPCSELIRAWGSVTEVTANHYDEESDEETTFSDTDVAELWKALEKELEQIY